MNYKDPLKMINPAAVAAIANTDMTLQPPIPANEKGAASHCLAKRFKTLQGKYTVI